MSDSRDTNHDGKVSLVEKVKGALPGHKDQSTTHTSTQYTTNTVAALPVVAALPMAVAGAPLVGVNTQQQVHTQQQFASGSNAHIVSGSNAHIVSGSNAHIVSGSNAHVASGSNAHIVSGSNAHIASAQSVGAATGEVRLELHEEQLAISKRQVEAGEVGIHKHVQAERVEQTVALRREEVIVERRPLSGIADPNARIMEQDEILRVPLHREEVIVEKRVVPTEEVIVRKKEVVENQTVGATLRSEYVDTVQTQVSQTGAYADSRDLNRDGHVSVGEKLKSATGSHVSGSAARG